MTEHRKRPPRRLAWEILGALVLCLLIAVCLYHLLYLCGTAAVESYCTAKDITPDEIERIEQDAWLRSFSLMLSVVFFTLLSLFILGERLAYIHVILKGIRLLQAGKLDDALPCEGNNELTRLGEAINTLAAEQKRVKAEEEALLQEKEQLIRTLSHDIRTPLTTILSYTEHMSAHPDIPHDERQTYLALMQKKAEQIRELTEVLLDGSRRSPEHFADARLLMTQLADDFASELENDFAVSSDLSACLPFSASFDVRELQQIFDNLISNVRKYAHPQMPVRLTIRSELDLLTIVQSNHIRHAAEQPEGYQLGLRSIQRIAQNYHGRAEVRQTDDIFTITIRLSV